MTRPTAPLASHVIRTYHLSQQVAVTYLVIVLAGPAAVILEPRLWFVFVPLSVSLLWAVFKLRRLQVTLSADAIELRRGADLRRMRLVEMRGYRKVGGRHPRIVFEPRDASVHGLRIPDIFNFDAEFQAWLSRIPDLGAQEREAAVREEDAAFRQRQAEFERRDAEWRRKAAARPPD